MKKYLMTAVAALAFGGIITSCSHDEALTGNGKISVLENYEDAFVSRFGTPAANQDWGFNTLGVYQKETETPAMTRQSQPSYRFPADADASKFLDDVPAGVDSYSKECQDNNQTDGYPSGISYVDPSWKGQVNIWGTWDGNQNTGGTLYIKGDNDFTNRKFYIKDNSEIYLVKNAILRLNSENAANLQPGCNFYLAEGAKIITSAELKLNNGLHIYNHGTIEAGTLSTNSNSWLVNSGTVKIEGNISVENTESVIENNGTITAANLYTAGSGKFENNANVTISGTTLVHSNNNTWVNNGQYHTGYFVYNAGSDDVINNCHLVVDEDFNINLGDNPGNGNFKNDGGVETKNFNGGGNWTGTFIGKYLSFNGGPFYIYMGAGAVFKVSETATMNATKADYGFYGPSSGDYAVLEAQNIQKGAANQGFEVTYGGKLAVVCQTHFVQGYSGSYPYIDFKNGCSEDNIYTGGTKPANISIPETTCNPGFDPGNNVRPDDGSVMIIAEDLTTSERGDFDFNDVVFTVKWNSESSAEITLKAAGGTLPLYIGSEDEAHEVHNIFGVAVNQMVNTNTNLSITLPEKTFTLNGDFQGQAINIPVMVRKNGSLITLQANQGRAPHKICVKSSFRWCDERVDIETEYRNFSSWVQDPSVSWY